MDSADAPLPEDAPVPAPEPAFRRNVGGRPTKFSQDRADTIVLYVRAGNYIETAAAAADIDKTTLYRWLRQGARASERSSLGRFYHAVKRASAESEARDVAIITNAAGQGFWQAAAWRLERKFPSRWGRRVSIDLAVELREEARRMAEERGLPFEEVLAEAEAVLREHGISDY
jgi:hypothetical protein